MPHVSAAASLWDNGPFVTAVGTGPGGADLSRTEASLLGAGVNRTSPLIGALNNKAADNFTVPSGTTWTISSITVYVYESKTGGGGSANSISAFYPVIFDSTPTGTNPTPLYGSFTTNQFSSAIFTNAYRIGQTGSATDNTRAIFAVTADVSALNWSVGPGDHWLGWSVDSSGSSVVTDNSIPVTPRGPLVGQRNYRAQSGSGSWNANSDPGYAGTDKGIDLSFALAGVAVPEPTTAGLIAAALFAARRRR